MSDISYSPIITYINSQLPGKLSEEEIEVDYSGESLEIMYVTLLETVSHELQSACLGWVRRA